MAKLLRIREAAAKAGVTDRTVRRWIAEGRLNAVGSGRRRMVELEAVEAARDRSPGVRAANARDELAELRGRYQELRERIVALEAELAEERRRTGRLEALADRAA